MQKHVNKLKTAMLCSYISDCRTKNPILHGTTPALNWSIIVNNNLPESLHQICLQFGECQKIVKQELAAPYYMDNFWIEGSLDWYEMMYQYVGD